MNPDPNDSAVITEKLKHEADATRARLLQVVDALDAKRHIVKTQDGKAPTGFPPSLYLPLGAAAVGAGALALAKLGPFKPHSIGARLLTQFSIALFAAAATEGVKVGLKTAAKAALKSRGVLK